MVLQYHHIDLILLKSKDFRMHVHNVKVEIFKKYIAEIYASIHCYSGFIAEINTPTIRINIMYERLR